MQEFCKTMMPQSLFLQSLLNARGKQTHLGIFYHISFMYLELLAPAVKSCKIFLVTLDK